MDTYWKQEFKTAMQAKKMTYAELAKSLNMSVPGTKKIFQKDDIGLDRFCRICRVLDLDISTLMNKGYVRTYKIREISKEADSYFVNTPRAFHLYWCLTVERMGLSDTVKKLKMDKKEIYKYLRRLDEFGLLKWLEGDEIQIPELDTFVFNRKARSLKKYLQPEALTLVEETLNENPPRNNAAFLVLSLSEANFQELQTEFSETLARFAVKFPYQGIPKSKEDDKKPVRILYCLKEGALF